MPHRVASFFRNPTGSFESQVIHLKKSAIRSRTKSPHRTTAGAATPERPCADRAASYASSLDDDNNDNDTTSMDEPPPAAADAHSTTTPAATPTPTPTPTTTPQQPPTPPVGRVADDSPRLRPRDDLKDKDKDKDHHHHRLSFPGIHIGRSHHHHHREHSASPHAHLSWSIESPPIIFHGDADSSTGALVSGQLFLDVRDDAFDVAAFRAALSLRVAHKKPFAAHCADCASQLTLLKEWNFLPAPGRALHRGVHPFPFSVLLDGHLPATLDSPLVAITYEFKAEALPARPGAPAVRLERLFDVKRSLPPPELPHHSVRVFPPTNVKASVHYQQVIHPIGTNTLAMHLDGIARTSPAAGATVEYWKLKKLTWRLEETLRTVAPACDKHRPAAAAAAAAAGEGADQQQQQQQQQQKRGAARAETRVIGEKTLFSGWKSTYAGPTDSSVDLELEYALNRHAKYCCDLKSRDGTEVSHQLLLEMVVSQECAPVGKPGLVTQTGVGRILRMHFATILTERGGIGISWDNEAPPIYQDVPASPPAYCEDTVAAGLEGLPDVMESLDAAPGPSGTGSGRSSSRNSAEGHRS